MKNTTGTSASFCSIILCKKTQSRRYRRFQGREFATAETVGHAKNVAQAKQEAQQGAGHRGARIAASLNRMANKELAPTRIERAEANN